MKRKGITIWEQHVEHFLLGAAVLFFAVFTALQVISNPNEVDVPGGQPVDPGQVDAMLQQTASGLQRRLDPAADPSISIPDPQPILDQFEAEMVASISPKREVVPSHRRVVLAEEIGPIRDVAYVVPDVPAPFDVVAEQYFDAITPVTVDEIEPLKARFDEPPYDITWITAAARFDLGRIREQLRTKGADGSMPVPVNWYYNRMTVLDVKLEREERIRGTWTNRTLLDVLPGQASVRDRLAGEVDRGVRDSVLGYIAQEGVQEALIRPAFYPTVNDSWTPPDPREPVVSAELTEEQREIVLLTRRVNRLVAKREDLARQLLAAGGTLEEPLPVPPDESRPAPPDEDRRTAPPGAKAPPGAGAGGFGFGSGGNDRPSGRNDRALIESLRKRIHAQDRRIQSAQRKLAALRGDAPEEVAAEAADPGSMASDEIIVWAHDMDVEPDQVYRYRFTIELYNPFFAHKLDLLESQHALAERMTLASAASEWSTEIRAIPPLKVYVVKASGPTQENPGPLGMGQATAEVFRFYYGRWWVEQFSVQPGDRIGSAKAVGRRDQPGGPQTVDYGTDWFVLDIIEDADADRQSEARGLAARVLLQHRVDADSTMLLDPRAAATDLERSRLKDAVELAEIPEEVAQAGGCSP